MTILPLPVIATLGDPRGKKFLRQKAKEIIFDDLTRSERREIIRTMRRVMKAASGVGLAANQIGLPYRIFVAEFDNKFYAVLNPRLTQHSIETETAEEGCLSVPGKYGVVPRSLQVTLAGYTIEGKPFKIRARDFLARIFEHEVDHLDGKIYIDTAKEVYDAPRSERLQKKNNE